MLRLRSPLFASAVLLLGLLESAWAASAEPSAAGVEASALAQTKAAAEAGDAEAQYTLAKTFGAGADWDRWMTAAAAQGYGPAEDELAWTPHWPFFSNSDPKVIEHVIKSRGPEMRRALVLASSAADKGFAQSRELLALAYANGVLVPQDRVEAYKWFRLVKMAKDTPSESSPTDELVRALTLVEVQEAEARIASYQPGSTVIQIRDALIVPNLKLSGIVSKGGTYVADVNGTRLSPGESATLGVEGVAVTFECIEADAESVVFTLPPDKRRMIIEPGELARPAPE
jgi:hypothetical protein